MQVYDEKNHHFELIFCLPLWFGLKIHVYQNKCLCYNMEENFNYNNNLVQKSHW
jgi:hypothetical protein